MADMGAIDRIPETQESYARALRYTVAVAVGTSILIGVYRIVRGWPIHWFIISGYVIVVALTAVSPPELSASLMILEASPHRLLRCHWSRPWYRSCNGHSWPESNDRWFRADCLCQSGADHLRPYFRYCGVMR